MPTYLAGQKLTALAFNTEIKKIIARGERITDMTGTTTIVGVERIDDVPVKLGYAYRISATGMHVVSTVAADRVRVEVRYTTDGSTPTTSSAVLRGTPIMNRIIDASTGQNSPNIDAEYEPSADETLSLLLCVARASGTGTVKLFADTDFASQLKLYSSGSAVGDTGTDV